MRSRARPSLDPVQGGSHYGSGMARRRLLILAGMICVLAAATGVWPDPGQADAVPPADVESDPPDDADWFADAKLGIFVHWGPYSVPAWGDKTVVEKGLPVGLAYAEWYWYQQVWLPSGPVGAHHLETYGADKLYDDFLDDWRAEDYDPAQWADLFARSGARYAVLTTKHHDGWALFDSAASDRDTVAAGPRQDLVAPFVDAMRAEDLRVGLYYSLMEWFHPAYTADNGTQLLGGADIPIPKLDPKDPYTGAPVPYRGYEPPIDDYVQDQVHVQINELLTNYEPDLLWCDADWDVPTDEYWQLSGLIEDHRSQSHPILLNDRCALDGDFATREYAPSIEPGDRYFEATRGLGSSFGYNAEETDEDLIPSDELIDLFVDVVGKGGNLLLNVGPRADGTIPEIQTKRLVDLGAWLDVNGAGIYDTRPIDASLDDNIRATVGDDAAYVLLLSWPDDGLQPVPVDVGLEAGEEYEILGTDATARATVIDGQMSLDLGDAPAPAAAWTVRIPSADATTQELPPDQPSDGSTPPADDAPVLVLGGIITLIALVGGGVVISRKRASTTSDESSRS